MNCFVIQPFDGGKFDKRFKDVLEPAIRESQLEPYRVDRDPDVSIPIESIEKGIQSAAVCLADITTDNPNVWFELGFAISANKPVVMVCAGERSTKFPFDVQHRSIIKYSTESSGDFDDLRKKIVVRLTTILKKEATLERLAATPLATASGLSQYELVVLATIAGAAWTPDGLVTVSEIKRDAGKAGITTIATTLGLRKLVKAGFIEPGTATDEDGDSYVAFNITSEGWDWIAANEGKFVLQKPPQNEDVPF
jgi:hypothetical protein